MPAQSRAKAHLWPILALLIVTSVLGTFLGSMTFDDPFVTYRYASNLLAGHDLVYNLGEHVLSTTAPFYAVVLAAAALQMTKGASGPNLPALSNWLNVAMLFVGGCFLYLLAARLGQRWAGMLAALLYVSSPLLWLSLGFETGLYLALVLGGFYFYFEDRLSVAAILLALALLTRGDGILPAAALGLHHLVTNHRIPWRALAVYCAVSAPFLLYLTAEFGSPLPVTLGAKAAQARLGVTGFYAHTTFLQGLWILSKAYLRFSPLFLLWVPLALLGLRSAFERCRWLLPTVLWSALCLSGYHALGVSPYHWYYAPLVPTLTLLTGLGAVGAQRWLRRALPGRLGLHTAVIAVLGLMLLAPQLVVNAEMYQALRQPGLVQPEDSRYKVLPEAKVEVYRRAGEWLRENTEPDALIGVTEVGVIGYYSGRRMVDFLGLLRPEVVDALNRGDMAWALLYYQPDYVVLTRVNPLYSYDLRADAWFQLAYQPVQVFEDARFWSGPVTVYRRQTARTAHRGGSEIPAEAVPLHVSFDGKAELVAYRLDARALQPGQVLNVTLYWKCLAALDTDYTVFVHLLGQHELVIAQHDAYPCLGACPTRGWKVGDILADAHMLALPTTSYTPDEAQMEAGLYERASQRRLVATDGQGKSLGDSVRFDRLTIAPAQAGNIPNPMQINLGDQMALVGYDLDRRLLAPGQSVHLVLYWRGIKPMRENYSVFTYLMSPGGERVAQMDNWPQKGDAPTSTWQPGASVRDEYELTVPVSAPLGVYSIEIGAYLAETGHRLQVLDASGQPQADYLLLSSIRVHE